MKKIKINGYFIVVVICAAISVALIAKMVASGRGGAARQPEETGRPWYNSALPGTTALETRTPPTSETEPPPEEIILTDEDAASLINEKIGKDFPADGIGIHFEADGGLGISAVLSKDALKSYIKKNDIKLPTSASLLMAVMPSEIELYADCTLSSEPKTGLLNLTPEVIRVGGRELPPEMVPAGVFDDISAAINDALVDGGYYFTKTEFGDGFIRLLP